MGAEFSSVSEVRMIPIGRKLMLARSVILHHGHHLNPFHLGEAGALLHCAHSIRFIEHQRSGKIMNAMVKQQRHQRRRRTEDQHSRVRAAK